MTEVRKEAKLSEEDRARMTRLSEEIRGRLEEMSLIVARNLGLGRDGREAQFAPLSSMHHEGKTKAAKVIQLKGARIVCTSSGCGCYDEDTGICFVC